MLKAGMSNCSTSGILFDPRESADVLETGMSTRSSTATAPLRPYSPHEEPNPPPAVQSNPMSDPPPPYAPQHDSLTQLRSINNDATLSRTRSTDRFHLIPSIQPNAVSFRSYVFNLFHFFIHMLNIYILLITLTQCVHIIGPLTLVLHY